MNIQSNIFSHFAKMRVQTKKSTQKHSLMLKVNVFLIFNNLDKLLVQNKNRIFTCDSYE
jgi:hypothetical protein